MIYITLFIGSILLLYYAFNKQFDKGVEEMVKEFKKAFPNKCMICSYHRFGRENGLTKELKPKPHKCIEQALNGKEVDNG